MNSTGLKIINIQYNKKRIHEDPLINCLVGLQNKLNELNISIDQILKISIFFKPDLTEEFKWQRIKIEEKFKDYFRDQYPCFSVITDFPENGYEISIEVFVFTNTIDYLIEKKMFNDFRYSVLTGKDKIELYIAGIMLKEYDEKYFDITEHVEFVFYISLQILIKEGLDFNNIVRSWNYIENITGTFQKELKTYQNYQIFNDVRTTYYNKCNFKNGYPAATGIGMAKGGVVTEFIAVSTKDEFDINPIKNNLQTDAYSYSNNVLIGCPLERMTQISTPKFERAKLIIEDTERVLFISGTASIINEKTIAPDNVIEQTKITINLICSLLRNQTNEFYNKLYTNEICFRVYVKQKEDLPIVKAICENKWGKGYHQYLIADICRTDLLVEIECFSISYLSEIS